MCKECGCGISPQDMENEATRLYIESENDKNDTIKGPYTINSDNVTYINEESD